jgi:hypothetical protein
MAPQMQSLMRYDNPKLFSSGRDKPVKASGGKPNAKKVLHAHSMLTACAGRGLLPAFESRHL